MMGKGEGRGEKRRNKRSDTPSFHPTGSATSGEISGVGSFASQRAWGEKKKGRGGGRGRKGKLLFPSPKKICPKTVFCPKKGGSPFGRRKEEGGEMPSRRSSSSRRPISRTDCPGEKKEEEKEGHEHHFPLPSWFAMIREKEKKKGGKETGVIRVGGKTT